MTFIRIQREKFLSSSVPTRKSNCNSEKREAVSIIDRQLSENHKVEEDKSMCSQGSRKLPA